MGQGESRRNIKMEVSRFYQGNIRVERTRRDESVSDHCHTW